MIADRKRKNCNKARQQKHDIKLNNASTHTFYRTRTTQNVTLQSRVVKKTLKTNRGEVKFSSIFQFLSVSRAHLGLNHVLTRIFREIPCDSNEECKMEKQERIPAIKGIEEEKRMKDHENKIKLNL